MAGEDLEGPQLGAPPEAPPVPATIVTGLLGAGKTTLLKRLLRESGGLRVLLVQNEFAQEMGIEAPALIDATQQLLHQQQQQQQQQQQPPQQPQQQQPQQHQWASPVLLSSGERGLEGGPPQGPPLPYSNLVELPGGCLCCSVRGELVQAIECLLRVYREKVDAVVIETNGVADPQPIAEALWTDEQLMARLCLDGVVCLIDASNPHAVLAAAASPEAAAAAAAAAADGSVDEGILGASKRPLSLERHWGLGVAALKQLACADSVLLTKGDICGEQQLLQLQQQLARINPGAPIHRCVNGGAPLHAVLGLRAYSTGSRRPTELSQEAAAATAAAHTLCQQQQQQQQQQGRHECVSGGDCCPHNQGGLGSVLLSFALGGPSSAEPPKLFSLRLLQQTIGALLWGEETREETAAATREAEGEALAAAVFRCKGLFPAWRDYPDEEENDTSRWCVYELQGVGRSFEVRRVQQTSAAAAAAAAALAADGSGQTEAKLLFVGVGLRREQLEQRLLACVGKETLQG